MLESEALENKVNKDMRAPPVILVGNKICGNKKIGAKGILCEKKRDIYIKIQ